MIAQAKRLLSSDHFSVDGTLLEAWASPKSFRPKDGSGEPPGPERNGEQDLPTRTPPIDEPTLDGHEPGLGQHEDCEGDLDRRTTPMVFLIDWIDEQCPAPYCRLAIITMQTIPISSWTERIVACAATAECPADEMPTLLSAKSMPLSAKAIPLL